MCRQRRSARRRRCGGCRPRAPGPPARARAGGGRPRHGRGRAPRGARLPAGGRGQPAARPPRAAPRSRSRPTGSPAPRSTTALAACWLMRPAAGCGGRVPGRAARGARAGPAARGRRRTRSCAPRRRSCGTSRSWRATVRPARLAQPAPKGLLVCSSCVVLSGATLAFIRPVINVRAALCFTYADSSRSAWRVAREVQHGRAGHGRLLCAPMCRVLSCTDICEVLDRAGHGWLPMCRCRRAWLPPSAAWLFPPRSAAHDSGGWYFEWKGYQQSASPLCVLTRDSSGQCVLKVQAELGGCLLPCLMHRCEHSSNVPASWHAVEDGCQRPCARLCVWQVSPGAKSTQTWLYGRAGGSRPRCLC